MNTLPSQQDDQVSAYSFDLLPESVAQVPADRRDASRLLVVSREGGALQHHTFSELPNFLRAGDLVVANDTRVLPARLYGHKEATGGRVEVLALHPLDEADSWAAMVRPSAKTKPGTEVVVERRGDPERRHTITIEGHLPDGLRRVRGLDQQVLEAVGEMPLPPYIDRRAGPLEQDLERYQTVYASETGAAAAPTAGLHFTDKLLDELAQDDVEFGRVTLHVGAGTFQPVRSELLSNHPMHSERFRVPPAVAKQVAECEARGGRILAVGTTSCRSLETWHRLARPDDGIDRSSSLFLHPGNPPQMQMGLLTNFHLPQSTLLMLVSAFLGRERTLEIYELAQQEGYRFYSYGDAMLIL